MKEKNLVRVNGTLQSKEDIVKGPKLKNNVDIPDYDKIKARENPLETQTWGGTRRSNAREN